MPYPPTVASADPSVPADVTIFGGLGAVARAAHEYLTLACRGCDFHVSADGAVRGQLRIVQGSQYWLVLTYAEDPDRAEEAVAPVGCEDQLTRTLEYWQSWAEDCTYRGPYREAVVRSALTLKLLTYEPTGAVVAAPTTSLPEDIGGARNRDYRFSWLRDSSLILYALMTIGYGNEASDFMHWLERAVGTDPTRAPQIMYGIDGRRKLPEQIIDNLNGYRGSRPVRTGNAAANQRQLDVYGEVLRAAYMHYRRGAHEAPRPGPDAAAWQVLSGLVQQAADHWSESGRGIWEVRGGAQPFLYGKLMCWAALDSGVRLLQEHHLDGPEVQWRRARDDVRKAILQHGYDRELGAFTQAFDSRTLDASALIIPRIGFLSASDPRVRSTVKRIRQQLTRGGLVYRYCTSDGLPGGEGAFTLCTFWLANALALEGNIDDARTIFEGALSHANDLGLLAEEFDPGCGEQLGNFPQGFSHLALIGAAVDIARAIQEGAEHAPRTEAQRAAAAQRASTSVG
jgi:GH15 family glucan-1,4-alpha-glucosidase